MASSIQRQSIVSTIVIYVGFAFGAVNLWLLQKLIGGEYYGLTRVVNDTGFIVAVVATLGSQAMVAKFLPFYKHYLPEAKNDLPFVALCMAATGAVLSLLAIYFLKPYIIIVFGRNNPFFIDFYWTIIPFTFLLLAYLFLEPFLWHSGNAIWGPILKETLVRLLTSVMVVLLLLKLIDARMFVSLFAFLYLLPVLIAIYILVKCKGIGIHVTISSVTRRLKGRIIGFTWFLFLTNIFTTASLVCDTLFLGSMKGFARATEFAIAQFFGSVLEVPNRAIMGSAIPVLAEYWRTKNLHGIQSIYKKSAMNLMIAGILFGGLIIINLKNVLGFFPPGYMVIVIPAIVIILSKLVDLATGLNTQIIQTSNLWKFDFYSTIIYTVVAIPLNFLLIREWGIYGAALANLLANFIKNGIRWWYLYHKFKLQPFTYKNLELIVISSVVVASIWFIPAITNVFIDVPVRTGLFLLLFALLVVQRKYSDEVMWIWHKYKTLLLQKMGR
ncbi:MAG: lipopolysaccharide biosynthesis protein [Chitinophagaceae bacterium]